MKEFNDIPDYRLKIKHPSENEWTFRDEVRMTMYENEDAFILEMIRPYCEGIMKCESHHTLPKEAIKQALLTFSREHSEEWADLLAVYGKEQT